MKKKRYLSMVLVTALVCSLVLAGCGGSGSSASETVATEETVEEAKEPAEAAEKPAESAEEPATEAEEEAQVLEDVKEEIEAEEPVVEEAAEEAEEAADVPFDETDAYEEIESVIDENFSTVEHEMVYDRETKDLNLYFESPAGIKSALDAGNDEIAEAWQQVVDAMITFGDTLTTLVKSVGDVNNINVYVVEELKSDNDYSEGDYLLWVQNGTVEYNYAD